ncbi:hypothetical protein AMJ50_00365 [Parcubacteria bacterium DG_74_3]|nr:MAG: hypothetical protein AMJ50_00365 [Parcubacteria bacterium DG_74_3]
MSFSVGIVGLPNVGKSTLFKALTKKEVKISPRPFTTISPNIGQVSVPDQRLNEIANVIKPGKITPTTIEFVDIAGLVKGAHKGEGLGNQFLAHIRNCDAILEIIRAFEDLEVENVLGEINPEKEIETIKVELLMKDLETLTGLISKLEKKKDRKTLKKINFLTKIKESVSQGKQVSELEMTEEERLKIREYQLLTAKPAIYLLNTNRETSFPLKIPHLKINLKEEEETSDLSEREREELEMKSSLDELIAACYNILNLITFFTVARGKETKAWTIERGSKASETAGKVHSDFEKKFIKAEIVPWNQLVRVSSWSEARREGLLKIVGKDYIVQDGDVIEFKI